MGLSVLISAWLIGALGGLHCLAMCGGFLAAVATRDATARSDAAPRLPAIRIARRQAAYHFGRATTYALLGAAFGAAGAAMLKAADLLPVQRASYVVANAFLLVLGVSLASGMPGVAWLQRAGARAFGAVLPTVRPLLQRPGAAGKVMLGLVWGLVPCGLVYSVLPLALFSGGAWQGAAVMLAFGLGTLPNLVAAGMLLDRVQRALKGRTLRYAAAGVLIAFALLGIWRLLYVPGALAQGPFCLVP